jgi:esterase/lipase
MKSALEENKEFVVLLHGLARTSRSMRPIKKALEKNGFATFNVNYPSRKKPIEELSDYVLEKINQNFSDHPTNTLHSSSNNEVIPHFQSWPSCHARSPESGQRNYRQAWSI